jgi:periplasmic protein TonB
MIDPPSITDSASQSEVTSSAENAANPSNAANPTENLPTLQQRVMKARAVAAAGSLALARNELEAVRKESTDDMLRPVVDVLLVGISMELSDYGRAQTILDESFSNRNTRNGMSMGNYFAVAGRLLNATRARLDRYRTFGINVADTELQPEAQNDLNRLRQLLERIVKQAKEVQEGDKPRSTDAASLIEEAANLRISLARDNEERAQWQLEVADTRQHLVISNPQLPTAVKVTDDLARNSPLSRREVSPLKPQSSQPETTTNLVGTSVAESKAPAPIPTPTSVASVSPKEQKEEISSVSKPNNATKSVAESAPEAARGETNSSPGTKSQPPASAPTILASTQLSVKKTKTESEPVSVGILNEKAARRVLPSYPPAALNARITGIVMVHLTMDEQGSVISINRSEGPDALKQVAIDAVRQWKFKPVVINGKAVRATGYVSFNFKL